MSRKRYQQGRLQGLPEWWDAVGRAQFDFLVNHGLKPNHVLLDVGCGTFRAGRFFIEYLDIGHYCGIDQYVEAFDVGIEKVLEPAGLLEKQPHLHVIQLEEKQTDIADALGFDRFDYIWIHSVSIHLNAQMLAQALSDLASVLAPGGMMYVTVPVNPVERYEGDIQWGELARDGKLGDQIVTGPSASADFHHHETMAVLQSIVDAGLNLVSCPDYEHPYQMRMLELRREKSNMRAQHVFLQEAIAKLHSYVLLEWKPDECKQTTAEVGF